MTYSSHGDQLRRLVSTLPLPNCPGRAEPVKSVFGVGSADLRLLMR